jgi:streptogramin lyase
MDTPRPLFLLVLLAALAPHAAALAAPVPAGATPLPAPADLDAHRFWAMYYGPPLNRQVGGQLAEFTPHGPIAGTIQPGIVYPTHVAVDPRGPTYYGHRASRPVTRFNPATGAATELPAFNSELDSHPTGLTFDTTRNRLLRSTLGGEGFLFAYSPEQDRWSTLASLNNVDLWSLTYSAADDVLYGLTETSILRYDPQGRQTGSVRLSQRVARNYLWTYQLVATGDQLVLLSPPLTDPVLPGAPGVQRSYLIDPHTGEVTSLGPIRIVPEPGAAALWLAGIGAALFRRRRTKAAGGQVLRVA